MSQYIDYRTHAKSCGCCKNRMLDVKCSTETMHILTVKTSDYSRLNQEQYEMMCDLGMNRVIHDHFGIKTKFTFNTSNEMEEVAKWWNNHFK